MSISPSGRGFQLLRRRPECRHRLHPSARLERTQRCARKRRRHRPPRHHEFLHAAATRRSYPWCRRRCTELGNSNGFDIEMEDHGNLGHAGLIAGAQYAAGPGGARSNVAAVCPNSLDDAPQLHLDIDQDKADALGVSHVRRRRDSLSTAWGGASSTISSTAPASSASIWKAMRLPHDARSGQMVCADLAPAPWRLSHPSRRAAGRLAPPTLTRYNGFPSIEFQGGPRRASVRAPR